MAADSKTNNWLYRASDSEHVLIEEAVRRGRYPSVASFVREACLRLACEDELEPVFSELKEASEEFMYRAGALQRMRARMKDETSDDVQADDSAG